MRYTKPITELAVNSLGERQLEAHHLDDNFAAQDDAIQTITRALFEAGGVAVPGSVTLTGTNLRVQGRIGVTLDATAVVRIADETLALATLTAGKGLVIIVPVPTAINRSYTDIVTGENLTDTMNVSLGRLAVLGATEAGVTLDSSGYPACPANAVPVAQVTRTGGGVTLDAVLSPPVQVNSSVSGPAGADGVDGTDGADGISVTTAEINGSGHLILTLSDASTIDAGKVTDSGGTGVPAGGTTGQVLTKTSDADGDAGWQTPASGGGGGGGVTVGPVSALPSTAADGDLYSETTQGRLLHRQVVWREASGWPARRRRVPRAEAPGTVSPLAVSIGIDLTPTAAITVYGLRDASQPPGAQVRASIWRLSDQVLIAQSEVVTADLYGLLDAVFTVPAALEVGTQYRVGWSGSTTTLNMVAELPTWAGFTSPGGVWRRASEGFPYLNAGAGGIGFELLT